MRVFPVTATLSFAAVAGGSWLYGDAPVGDVTVLGLVLTGVIVGSLGFIPYIIAFALSFVPFIGPVASRVINSLWGYVLEFFPVQWTLLGVGVVIVFYAVAPDAARIVAFVIAVAALGWGVREILDIRS